MENPNEVKNTKTRIWAIAGGMALLALLIGAAYLAGRLFQAPPLSAGDGMVVIGDSREAKVSKGYMVAPAKELPTRPADIVGMATSVENNSIYVGLSSSQVVIIQDVDQADYESIVEVVITGETKLYRDATSIPDSGADRLEQSVVPIALDDLDADRPHAQVVAWGERRGDRLIADVVLCNMLPTFGD